jgi:hypothetical protein
MTTALVTYDAKRAAAAQAYVEQTHAAPAGDMLSIKGGLFSLGENSLGDQIVVCVLQSIYENTYFEGKYVEGVPAAPRCYAYGRPGDEMAPHISMAEHPDHFVPQHVTCNGCPKNEFGSADVGEGKACKNRVRLALIPAGQYTPRPKSRDFDLDLHDGSTQDGIEHFAHADALVLKIPPTSVKNWNEYVRKLAAIGQPPYGVATRIWLERHPKFQYLVQFEMIEPIADESFDTLHTRHTQLGGDVLAAPYSPPKEEDVERKQGVRGLVRR